MAIVSLTIVRSRPQKDGSFNIKVALAHGHRTTYISTPYNVDNAAQWRDGRVIGRADAAQMNKRLRHLLDEYQLRVDNLPNAELTIAQVRHLITHAPVTKPTIVQFCERFAQSLDRQRRTSYASNIRYTAAALERCFGSAAMFDSLTMYSLREFESHLRAAGQSDTTINIRMSHFKTLVNAAIYAGVVTYQQHPFQLYTPPRKRVREIALDKQQLARLRDADLSGARARRYIVARDVFMLSFYLGGVNLTDLLAIDFRQPCAVYRRSKTGQDVRLTIQPEAAAIAEKYAGNDGRLSFGYKFKNYADFRSMIGRSLRTLRDTLGIPQLCYYSARKTFVQFGFELGVPLSVLEYAVGHSPKDAQVRAIYNYFRVLQPQADDAVRKIIAFSLN